MSQEFRLSRGGWFRKSDAARPVPVTELLSLAGELAPDAAAVDLRAVHDRLDPAAPDDWRWVAAALALRLAGGPPGVLGLSGAQGTGKSTLARLLVSAFRELGESAVACSLDDFYLTADARARLAAEVHPLLATRGVPGTHDVALARRTLEALRVPGTVRLPRFDKGLDDRLPPAVWPAVTAPVSRVVFEGWCLGATAERADALAAPRNALESTEDADGAWRRYANEALAGSYRGLWAEIGFLVFLEVPGWPAVLAWRGRQEEDLPPDRRMSPAALERFVAHYERLTRHMLATLPAAADVTLRLDGDHRLAAVTAPEHS